LALVRILTGVLPLVGLLPLAGILALVRILAGVLALAGLLTLSRILTRVLPRVLAGLGLLFGAGRRGLDGRR
jgi:hypothetical protein